LHLAVVVTMALALTGFVCLCRQACRQGALSAWLWQGCEVSSAFFLVPESWRKLGRQKSVGRKIAANFSRFVAQIDRRKATEKVRANGKMSDIFTFIIA
jgi:hypothetical protein